MNLSTTSIQKNGCADTINTNLLVLFDLSRISTMQASYNTKLEFIWLKIFVGFGKFGRFFERGSATT